MTDSKTTTTSHEPPAPRRKKFRRWFVVLVFFLLFLLFLNGPGLRWILPRVANYYLGKAGASSSFNVQGSFTNGLSFSDLQVRTDGVLAELSIDRLEPNYQLGSLFKGKVDGIKINGVHLDLELGKGQEKKKSKPLDLKQLVGMIRSKRGDFIPVDIELTNFSLNAKRDGKDIIKLASSHFSKPSGSSEIQLNIGTITDASGLKSLKQKTIIYWGNNDLSVPRIELLPNVSLREFVITLPTGGEPAVNSNLHLDDAVFAIRTTPGFVTANIQLTSGHLQLEKSLARFGVQLPFSAKLSALIFEVNGILPDPTNATANAKVDFETLSWDGWNARMLNANIILAADQLNIDLDGTVLESKTTAHLEVPIIRNFAKFQPGDITGNLNILDIPAVMAQLSNRYSVIYASAPVPASKLDVNFSIDLEQNQIQSANARLQLKLEDEKIATPIELNSNWSKNSALAADLTIDGLKAEANYEIKPSNYRGSVTLDNFSSSRIKPWLSIFNVNIPKFENVSGKWSGNGGIQSKTHLGLLALNSASLIRENTPTISAKGNFYYNWPESVQAENFKLQVREQTLSLDAIFKNKLLDIKNLLWTDGENELAEGQVSLPVPADFSRWKETIKNDQRELSATIQSRVLPLDLLKPWVPALNKIDPKSNGQISLKIAGTYAQPIIHAKLQARDLRSPEKPTLPPADLVIELTGRDDRLTIEGAATAPDFAPANIKATMPFRIAEWVDQPALLKEESIEGRVDLPRLDLSRFSSLLPIAEKLSGKVIGDVKISGKIGKPDLVGSINLTELGIDFKDERFPDFKGAKVAAEFGLDRVTLKELKADLSGGSITGNGTLQIVNSALGNLDFNIQADHIPVIRNDSLIVRTSANLKLQGTFTQAVLSGTVSVVDGIFYRDIELLPIGVPFTGPALAKLPKIDARKTQATSMPEPFGNWGLNISLDLKDPFLIRGNLAAGKVTGDMRIGGTLSKPAPKGKLQIVGLKAALPFSTLSINTGVIRFTPESGFDPILDLSGSAEPRPYIVSINVYGRASDPKLILTSNPPLPENEIMTLLATGTTTEGLADPQLASSRALQLLAEEVRRGRFRIGKQLRPALGLLDKVDFSLAEKDPYSSDSFSTATLTLSDHWLLSAGLGAEGDSRLLAIWRLTFR